jgi:transcriptional regulator NrdR family protein
MSVIERDGHCPTCGQRAGTFTTDEGTSYFLATAEQEASEAAFLREQLRGAVDRMAVLEAALEMAASDSGRFTAEGYVERAASGGQ